MLLFLHKLQQLHIALLSVSEHLTAFRSELSVVSKIHLNVYIQLIFLCVVNLIFTFLWIVLNTLVIVSFWKSSQLRKKLCHFMIMVLSCFDFVALITHHIGNFLLYLLAKRGSKFVIQDEVLSGSLCTVYISWILFQYTPCDDFVMWQFFIAHQWPEVDC